MVQKLRPDNPAVQNVGQISCLSETHPLLSLLSLQLDDHHRKRQWKVDQCNAMMTKIMRNIE